MDIPSLLAEADFSTGLGFHSGELHDARSNGYHAADSPVHDPCSGSGTLGCSCCMAPQPAPQLLLILVRCRAFTVIQAQATLDP